MSNVYFHASEDTAEAVFFHAPNRKPQSTNPLKESTMSELEQAIIDGEYDIEVTEINGVIVKFTLMTCDTVGTYTRVRPEFQTIRNAIVDCTGVLRHDLDISFYRHEINRGNLETYCRAVLLNTFIPNPMELVERAVRIVQNIEASEAKGA